METYICYNLRHELVHILELKLFNVKLMQQKQQVTPRKTLKQAVRVPTTPE